jgi:hypothetical protein
MWGIRRCAHGETFSRFREAKRWKNALQDCANDLRTGMGKNVRRWPRCAKRMESFAFALMPRPFRTAGRGLPALPQPDKHESFDLALYQKFRTSGSPAPLADEVPRHFRRCGFQPRRMPKSMARLKAAPPKNRMHDSLNRSKSTEKHFSNDWKNFSAVFQ